MDKVCEHCVYAEKIQDKPMHRLCRLHRRGKVVPRDRYCDNWTDELDPAWRFDSGKGIR